MSTKKKLLLAGIILFFLAGTAFVVFNGKENKKATSTIPGLLPRKTTLSYTAEWKTVQDNAAVLLQKLSGNNADKVSALALIGIYLQEARITGNYGYYNEAAMSLVSRVLENDPVNFEALVYKTTVLLSRHQFAEALAVATALQNKYPYSAYVYGILVDAQVELGMYQEAIQSADKMISIRPDIRSYSRIAYLREIHGDIPGAIEAMKLAVGAGAPGDENTEWCRVQTGKLYEQWGKIKEAEIEYSIALANRENFPPALTGMARVATTKNDQEAALALYLQADSLSGDHTIKEGIAEIYAMTHQLQKEATTRQEILAHIEEIGKEGNEDMEMAHAYLGLQDHQKALEFALKEYKRRPGNIEVNETVAMVYLQLGDPQSALPFIKNALKTNCKKPALLSLAVQVHAAAGTAVRTSQ